MTDEKRMAFEQELNDMNMEQVVERMAALDEEVRSSESIEAVNESTEIKKLLNARKNELADLEERKNEALSLEREEKEIETIEERGNEEMTNKTYALDSAEYREAYFKQLMGRELSVEERTGMDSQTTSGGYAIPTVTANKIIENMVQIAPMLAEVDLMHIPSSVTIAVEGTRNAAAIHTENAAITGADDTLVKISLGGYEMAKVLPISAKLDAMSIPAFETWIVNNLSRCLAELIENYIINGTGSSQPKGIAYAETWVDGTNGVDWASTAPTVAEIEELIGLQNAAYIRNSKFLMNWGTFWNKIHSLRDDKFEPIVVHENGKYFIFGFEVVFSSKVANDTLFFGDYFEGLKANFAQDVMIESDRSSGFRYNATDYRGACIFDCTTVSGRIVKSAASF